MGKTLAPKEIGQRMSRIRATNTKPEILVRKLLWGMGLRYRLYVKDLPGTPDIVFRSKKKAIFVNGCFWHMHGCQFAQVPKSRPEFWIPKLQRNKLRDTAKVESLISLGWSVLVIWECETKNESALRDRLVTFLKASH